jgi:hypothetical protein
MPLLAKPFGGPATNFASPARRVGKTGVFDVSKKLFAGLAAAAAFISAPASAVTFTTTGSDSVNGTFGNSATFSAGGIGVRASAWRAVTNPGGFTFAVETSYMGRFSNGLGATSTGDSSGANNLHTVDNQNGFDFILLQFDRNVRLTGADLTAFSIGGSTDNDAYISTGITGLSWGTKIDLTTQGALVTALLNNGMSIKSSAGTPTTRSFASYTQTGNLWLIAADRFNTDGLDGFKINKLVVTAAVPEPATWAMMVGGFGLLGGVARRRRSSGRVLA